MEKGKGGGKKAYLSDFHINDKGAYEYGGETYIYEGDSKLKSFIKIWVPILIGFIIFIGLGFINSEGTDSVFVIIPFMGTFVSAISCIWGLLRLSLSKEPIYAYVYEATVKKLPFRIALTIVFCVLYIIGVLFVHLVHNAVYGAVAGVMFVLAKIAYGGLNFTKINKGFVD